MRLVRTGLDIRADIDDKPFRRRYLLVAPYLLYAGRIEKGKGLEAVFDYYRALKNEAYVDLVLIGKKLMDLPAVQGLKYLGYRLRGRQAGRLQGRRALPAAFAAGKPFHHHPGILFRADAGAGQPPLRGPARARRSFRAAAWPTATKRNSWPASAGCTAGRPCARSMGEKGLEYVKKYYSWDAVLAEIKEGIAEILEIE